MPSRIVQAGKRCANSGGGGGGGRDEEEEESMIPMAATITSAQKKRKTADEKSSAVVVFSGGIDSVCVAAMQKAQYDNVYGITFSYGQKAGREMTIAKLLAKKIRLKQHKIVDIGFMKQLYGDSNVLTSAKRRGLPGEFEYSIVVPIRNAVFLSIAAAWAFSIGATRVAYGAHTGDTYYPDCRPLFAKKLESAFNAGESDGIKSDLRKKVEIWSPFIAKLSKRDLIRGGADALGDLIYETWSCYDSKRLQCGRCESCMNRRRAFADAGVADKTKYLAD